VLMHGFPQKWWKWRYVAPDPAQGIASALGSRGLHYVPSTKTYPFPGAHGRQLVEVPGFVRERVKTTVKRRARLGRSAPGGAQPRLSAATEAEISELARPESQGDG
jgi:hypothetical protein